jgi:hypothetical protein
VQDAACFDAQNRVALVDTDEGHTDNLADLDSFSFPQFLLFN